MRKCPLPRSEFRVANVTALSLRLSETREASAEDSPAGQRGSHALFFYYRLGNASYRTYAIRLTHYSLIAFNKDLSNPYARPGPMWPIRLDII